MKIIADLSKGVLILEGSRFTISNKIRTLRDNTRPKAQVVCSIPANLPYDPQPFPKGTWNIYAVEWQSEKGFDYNEYGPCKIRTNAFCIVNVWELDQDGDYSKETEKRIKDEGYLLHWTSYNTTLGCIKIESIKNAEIIGKIIEATLKKGEVVQLEVI